MYITDFDKFTVAAIFTDINQQRIEGVSSWRSNLIEGSRIVFPGDPY